MSKAPCGLENGRINKIKSINFPNSVGCFYAAMTEFLGYKPFNDEWKVMGMAAYGDSNKHPQIDKLVSLKDKGEYELDLSFFDFYNFSLLNQATKINSFFQISNINCSFSTTF